MLLAFTVVVLKENPWTSSASIPGKLTNCWATPDLLNQGLYFNNSPSDSDATTYYTVL